MLRLLLIFLLMLTPQLEANEYCCKIDLNIYQLETNSTSIQLLSRPLGDYGSFGLMYGFRYYPKDNDEPRLGASDIGAVWQVELDLVRGTLRKILLVSDLKIGQTSYQSEFIPDEQASKHGFLESTIIFATEEISDAFFNFGIGVGWRVNFLDGNYRKTLTSVQVDADHLYPQMYFSWRL